VFERPHEPSSERSFERPPIDITSERAGQTLRLSKGIVKDVKCLILLALFDFEAC
jgi:hypothetical protein